MTTLTSRAISTLIATYYPTNFSDLDHITKLIDALIETGNRFAAECGANPGAEFETISASYETIIENPEFASLRDALDHRHCAQHSRLPLITRYELADICHTEILNIARAEDWSSKMSMQFAYLQACLAICGVIRAGEEAGYLEDIFEDLKMKSRMSGGSWSVQFAPFHEDTEEAAVPMYETSRVFGETFEQAANTHFTELASARDGDLTGVLVHHVVSDDGRMPESSLEAAITSEAGVQRLHYKLSADDLKLQAMAGILAFRTPAMDVLDLFELRNHYGHIYSLHFKDFGIVIVDPDAWYELHEDEPNSVPPVILLGNGEATMTAARMRAIKAGIATLQQHPDLSGIQSLSCKSFCPV